MQAVELIEGVAAANLKSSMVFFYDLVEAVGCLVWIGLECGKEVLHLLGQAWLVVLERQDVIRPSRSNGLRNARLTPLFRYAPQRCHPPHKQAQVQQPKQGQKQNRGSAVQLREKLNALLKLTALLS